MAGCDAHDNKPIQPTESPSPLMGEESKPVPVPDTGAEGENNKALPPCHSEQSEESKNSDTITPARHTGFKAVSTARGKQQVQNNHLSTPIHASPHRPVIPASLTVIPA